MVTSSRLTGSLKAESMTSFPGTIFHLGIISSTLVNRLITKGCGFTFSEICEFPILTPLQSINSFSFGKFTNVEFDYLCFHTLHMGATKIAPCQNEGSFLCINKATAPPIDSPYRNLFLVIYSSWPVFFP